MTEEENNVIKVDFTPHIEDEKPITADEAELRVYYVEETRTIGLEFDRPVKEFKLDEENADKFLGALVATFMRMKESKCPTPK